MKPMSFALGTALLLAPAVGFTHGQPPAPTHGGEVQDAHGNWVELAVSGDRVEVYVTDEHGQPIPASQVAGTATVMAGGQPQKVQISPAQGNGLIGRLPIAVSGRVVATVSLKVSGKTATARFVSAG